MSTESKEPNLNPINYGRIPMDDIHPEARRIAVAWMEGWEEWMKTSIHEKVKLASDIQNFAIEYSRASQEEVERLNKVILESDTYKEVERLREAMEKLSNIGIYGDDPNISGEVFRIIASALTPTSSVK